MDEEPGWQPDRTRDRAPPVALERAPPKKGPPWSPRRVSALTPPVHGGDGLQPPHDTPFGDTLSAPVLGFVGVEFSQLSKRMRLSSWSGSGHGEAKEPAADGSAGSFSAEVGIA